jgi:hypothetical protein
VAFALPLPLPPRVKRLRADKGNLERGESFLILGIRRAREFPWVTIGKLVKEELYSAGL